MSQPSDIEEIAGDAPTRSRGATLILAIVIVALATLTGFLAGRATAPAGLAGVSQPSDLVRPTWVSDALIKAFYDHPSSTSACTSHGTVRCQPLVGMLVDDVAWQGAVDTFWPRVVPQTVTSGRVIVAAPFGAGSTDASPVLILRPERGTDSRLQGISVNGRVFLFDLGNLRAGWYALITLEDVGPPTGVLTTAFGIIVS